MYHGKHFYLYRLQLWLYANLQRTTGFLFQICALVPLKMLSHQLQATMCNCTNKLKMYHGDSSLYTLTIFSYGLYAKLQRATGITYECHAIVPLRLLSHQLQATMCNCTNEVKMNHEQCSLFTLTIFGHGYMQIAENNWLSYLQLCTSTLKIAQSLALNTNMQLYK